MSSLYDMYQESPWMACKNLENKFVCERCMQDKYLRKIIRSLLESNECTYCKRKSKKLIGAPLQELIGPIYYGMTTEWEHPNDILGWCKAEGGWLGEDVYDTYELSWFIEDKAEIVNDELIKDIVDCLSDYQWCRDPSGTDFSEDLNISWNYFSSLIKHNYRYTFFQIDEKIYLDPDPWGDEIRISPKQFLHVLSSIIKMNSNMIKKIKQGDRFFRARLFDNNTDKIYTAKELGSPPSEYAKTSRMSPAGIPIFYGALDKDTALKEIIIRKNSNHKFAIVAEFEVLKSLEILNLCNIHNVVSIFDEKKRGLRKATKFLRKFSEEISREIILDGREHIDYVPTQVITEYFRHIYKHKRKESLDGIFYHNARQPNGINCALFIENDQCIDGNENLGGNQVLRIISQERIEL